MRTLIVALLLLATAQAETVDLYLGPTETDYLLSENVEDERFSNTFFGYLPGEQPYWLLGDAENMEPSEDSLTYWEVNLTTLDPLPDRNLDGEIPIHVDLTFVQLGASVEGEYVPVVALMDINVSWELRFDGLIVATGEGQSIQGQVDENDVHLRWNVTATGALPDVATLRLMVDGPATYVAIAGNGESFVSMTLADVPEATTSSSASTTSSSSSTTTSSTTSSTTTSSSSSTTASSSSSTPSASSSSSSAAGNPEQKESPMPLLVVIGALVLAMRSRIS